MITEDNEAWKDRYEHLRRQALESSEAIALDRWGLSLFIRKGVAGWMSAWRDPAACFESATVDRGEDQIPLSRLPASWQQEATRLLANMALGHCHCQLAIST
jgi:hypothetical protein